MSVDFLSLDEAGDILALCGYSANETLSSSAIVVKSDKRVRLIDYYSMFYYYNTTFGQMSYSGYYEYYSMFSAYEDYSDYLETLIYDSEFYFYGDALITGLVEYVTLDVVPKAYFVTSHGENSASDGNFAKLLTAMEYDYAELALADGMAVPNDAGCLVINDPDVDISVDEKDTLLEYLDAGGRLLLITDTENLLMPNLMAVMDHYGATASSDIVAEKVDEKESFVVTPLLNSDHDIIASMGSYVPKITEANPINIKDELRSSQLVVPLLTSSKQAYLKDSPEKIGEYVLGVAVEEEGSSDTTRLVWFTGAESFNGDLETADNLALLVYSLAWLNKTYTSEVEDINATIYSESIMNVPENVIIWCGTLTVLVCAVLIAVGAFIRYSRRKR